MNSEKASTLKLLREGMGQPVHVLENRSGDAYHAVRARLPELSETSMIPVMFLITTLAFLEAGTTEGVDGWTPADFLSYLRFEHGSLVVRLDVIRERAVFTEVNLNPKGEISIETRGRGQSATRWLAYVEGRSHLHRVNVNLS